MKNMEMNAAARDFLNRAYKVDQRIDSKIEQVGSLRSLATKATSVLSDMKVQTSHDGRRMEDLVVKIVDLEREINGDIDELIDLKREIMDAIKTVDSPDMQLLLEKRYLLFLSWEQIAKDMEYSTDHVYRLHRDALKKISIA